jgi:8-oxo-dGTP pyrophosphatase MutT (NUDIX family)
MSFTTNADFEARLTTRLDPLDARPSHVLCGDHDFEFVGDPALLTPAAILAPVVRRPEGWTLMLTQRTHSMPTHPGQISFPGGRIQDLDASAVDAAIRETFEETGLDPGFIRPVGGYDAYRTGTGYLINPIVAFVEPGFRLAPDPREVEEVFEAPLNFLMNPQNHERHERLFKGKARRFYAMPFEGRYIWGATAGLIRALYERLYLPSEATP